MDFFLQVIKVRKKSFIAIAAMVIANLLLYSYVFHFQQPKLETLQNLWLEKRQRAAAAPVDKTYIFSQGKKDLAVFQSMIPRKSDFTRIISELFDIGSNNGLSIGNITYKPELMKNRGLLVYNITLAVTGRYAAIKSFVSDIERSREMIAVDNISLENSDPSQDSVKIVMQLSAFFKAEKS